jgi:hypothetical protein
MTKGTLTMNDIGRREALDEVLRLLRQGQTTNSLMTLSGVYCLAEASG